MWNSPPPSASYLVLALVHLAASACTQQLVLKQFNLRPRGRVEAIDQLPHEKRKRCRHSRAQCGDEWQGKAIPNWQCPERRVDKCIQCPPCIPPALPAFRSPTHLRCVHNEVQIGAQGQVPKAVSQQEHVLRNAGAGLQLPLGCRWRRQQRISWCFCTAWKGQCSQLGFDSYGSLFGQQLWPFCDSDPDRDCCSATGAPACVQAACTTSPFPLTVSSAWHLFTIVRSRKAESAAAGCGNDCDAWLGAGCAQLG